MADEEDTKLNRLTTNRSRSGDQNESFQQESKTANISGKYTGNCFNCGSNYFPGHKQVCPAQGKHVVRVESSTILPKFAAVHQCESQNFVTKTRKNRMKSTTLSKQS